MTRSSTRIPHRDDAPNACRGGRRGARPALLVALVALVALTLATAPEPAPARAAPVARPSAPSVGPAPAGPAAVAQAACGIAVQAAVAAGTLHVVGTDGADLVRLRREAAAGTVAVFAPATAATPGWTFAANDVQSIHVRLCDGDDLVVVDDSGGALSSVWPLRVDGDGGADTVFGGLDLGAVTLGDALQMVATLRTAGDLLDDALALLDASPGPCAAAPCLVAGAADVLRGAGADVVGPAGAYARDVERTLVGPAAATVRDAHGRLGAFVTTFVSQTAQSLAADGRDLQASVEVAVDDVELLLPTAQALLTDTATLYEHVASLGLDVQSRDPIGVFTRTVESQTATLAVLARRCAEDPEPAESTADEDQQDPSGLSAACAELERRIEALEAVTDDVGDDARPGSSAARLEAEGDAFAARGDGLAAAGDGVGDDENAASAAARLETEGDAVVAAADALQVDADALAVDWEAWVAQAEAALDAAGAGMDLRGQAEVFAAADVLRARAGADIHDAADRLRARADLLRTELDTLMAAAAPLLGGGAQRSRLAATSSTACTVTPTQTLTGGTGSDALVGSGGSDQIEGGDGADLIVGADGADRLLGEDGNDLVFGGDGGDEIKGGPDADVLAGNGADDCLYGGGGQTLTKGSLSVDLGDLFFGQGGADLIVSGDGTDDTRTEVDLAWGGDGVDEMHLGHGGQLKLGELTFQLGNLAFGDGGADDIAAGDGVDVVFGGADDDTVTVGRGTVFDLADSGGTSVLRLPLGDLVFGDAGGDTIHGDDPDADRADDDIDVLFGGDGADTIRGYGGGVLSVGDAASPSFELALGNLVLGGAGADDIETADGVDVVFGGGDGDTVQAGQGADFDVAGSDDASTFRLALGDLVFGDGGADTLHGDDPDADRADDDVDVLFGGDDADTLRGYGGGLLSIGDAADPSFELVLGNVVFGGTGADDIATLDGIDVVFGGPDDDTVAVGAGDTLAIDDDFTIQLGDAVFGQGGDDTLHGDAPSAGDDVDDDGVDALFGGPGADKLYGGAGGLIEVPDQDFCLLWGNLLFGGDGDDLLRGDYEDWDAAAPRGGIDLAFGAAGVDTIEGGGGSIIVIGDLTSGQAVVIWFGNLLFGGPDDDAIRGADAADLSTCSNATLDGFLNGLGVNGLGGGADLVFGGGGDDTVDAYDGIDIVFGQDGDDTLRADDGGIVIVPIEGIPTPINFGNVMFGNDGEDTISSKGQIWLLVFAQLEVDLLFGGGCDDDIDAGDGFNLAFGNRANDRIRAGDGVNLLFGNDHDDDLTAGSGLNVAFGNRGDDAVRGGADAGGVYVLFGNRGADDVAGAAGLTVAFGNRDADDVRGGNGVSVLFGNAADDAVVGGAGLTVAFGNRGRDDVRAGGGLAVLFGNRDADDVRCGDGVCVAFGGDDHDLVGAGNGLGILFGNADEDRVTTGAGLGLAFGNAGRDIVRAGGGGLFLGFGNAADDVIVGGAGVNVAFGNYGRDDFFGGGGTNLFFGNHDPDAVRGGGSADFLFGNPGDDTLTGGGGTDFLFGNLGSDTLGSHDGADFLFGNRGDDHVRAADGSGCDLLFGNRGNDTLDKCQSCDMRFGGRGTDTKTASCAAVSPSAPSRGEVRGRVWIDLDGDATGDIGHAGVTVAAGPHSTVTDGDGFYRLATLAAGASHSVAETVPAGFVQVSTPIAHAVVVGGQGIDLFVDRDFVNRARCAVSPDGWGCVAGGCERTPGAGGVPACRPMAVRPVLRCASTGAAVASPSDCPCGDAAPSWEVVTCDCVASDAGCTLILDPVTGPRCGGSCPERPGGPCQLQVVGGVYRCGCRPFGVVHLPIVVVDVASGRITSTPTSTPRVTRPPAATATPRPTATVFAATATARPSATARPAATATPRPTASPRPLGADAQGAAGPAGGARAAGRMQQVAPPLDGAWTVLDELMPVGAFYAPLVVYTATVPVRLDVTDLFVVSDRHEVYLDGQLLGATPAVADWTALGGGPEDPPYTADPAAAWAQAAFSKATFTLPAGTHVVTLRNTHIPAQAGGAPYPDGTVAFRLTAREGPTPTATPGCAPRPAGMVAWWALDEPGGAVARDSVGGHHGAVAGAATVVDPAKVLAGRLFDGGLVRVADAPALDGGDAGLSVDAWIRPASAGGVAPIVTKRYAPADLPLGWSLHLVDGRLGFAWSTAAGSVEATAPVTVTARAWHLVAASVRRGSPTGGQLFLDGALVHTFDTTALAGGADTDAALHMAAQPALGRGQPTSFFVGTIDEVEVFDRPITGADVAAIFAADRAGKCDKPRPPAATPTATQRVPAPTPFPPIPLGAAGTAGAGTRGW